MKRSSKKLTFRAIAAAAVMTAAAGTFSACDSVNEVVYGPPPGISDDSGSYNEDVYGPPGPCDDPDSINETVYGPPEDLGEPVGYNGDVSGTADMDEEEETRSGDV